MKTDAFHRKYHIYLPVLAFAGLAFIFGCAPPNMNASKDLVSVTVLPAHSPVWAYTITTRNVENLVAIEFVSPSDLEDVAVIPIPTIWEIEKTHTPNSIRVALKGSIFGTRATQSRSLKLLLKSKNKDLKSGDITVRVTDFRGRITTIEPIAGPV